MIIQLLTYDGECENLKGKDLVINSLHSPQSLDEFDINIIDMRDEDIWKYNGVNIVSINIKKDLESLSLMISNKKKTSILILFPQNITFKFNYYKYEDAYHCSSELKDIIELMTDRILSVLHTPIKTLKVRYENTKTIISGKEIKASFYFDNNQKLIFTKSLQSEKPTTIGINNIILSTLNIETYNSLMDFLKEIKLIENKEQIPDWIKEEQMFDDQKQLEIIKEKSEIIENAKKDISLAEETILKNERYKSILYTSGDELVEVVFDILKEMLNCDLSEFQDNKKEDFNFGIDDKVFIGEIKGINTNVKNANVAQLDHHVQNYLDEHDDLKKENIIALLIINHQRNKPLISRESVNQDAINLATRNQSLIIETITLLRIFEQFFNKEINTIDCLNMLTNNTGLLSI